MQPVLWTKGVLLSPQHLQTQDRFFEELLQFRLSALTFQPWGFHALTVDREALAGGTFGLTAAAGILPDGLLFDAPAADAAPPPRPLDGAWTPDQTSLDVFLAVPEYRLDGHNVSAGQRDRSTRYEAEVVMRRDENTGLAERPVQVAKKNLRLQFEGESLEGNTVLRVARVLRSAAGGYELDGRFVPPLLSISASDYLMAIARRLVEILAAKSSTLSGMRRQRNQSLADFGISDVANFWLLYTINTHFPQLRHLFETRRGHPAELYEAMLSLAGALTTFSTTLHPRALPPYDHDDLGGCFTRLDETVREQLETVVPATHVSIPLRQVRPATYAAALDEDRYLAAPHIYLALSTEARMADIAQRVPHILKVSSADNLERLVRLALGGLPLTYVPSPPTSVPMKMNYHYFQLARQGPEWDAIAGARSLAVYVPAELPGAQLELVVVLR